MAQRTRAEILNALATMKKHPAVGPGEEQEALQMAQLQVLLDIRDSVNYMSESQQRYDQEYQRQQAEAARRRAEPQDGGEQ